MLTAALETAATAAVTVFPNSTMTLDYVADPGQVTPAAIRRAVAYVDAKRRLADHPAELGVRPPPQPNPAHVKHCPSWTVSGAPRAGRR